MDDPQCAVTHAPLTVLPTPFPADSFAKAKRAMTMLNTVMDNVSRDTEYLQQTLKAAAVHDDFTVQFLLILQAVANTSRSLNMAEVAFLAGSLAADTPDSGASQQDTGQACAGSQPL